MNRISRYKNGKKGTDKKRYSTDTFSLELGRLGRNRVRRVTLSPRDTEESV